MKPFYNHIIFVSFISWFTAQVIKVILNLITKKKFIPERFVGAGGMPSSHSAIVCSLTVSIAKIEGVNSTFFALSLVLAAIVMYDAMGVRRAAGEHAKAINKIVDKIDTEEPLTNSSDSSNKTPSNFKELKEYLGHTPLEVLGGALLGILMAMIIPVLK